MELRKRKNAAAVAAAADCTLLYGTQFPLPISLAGSLSRGLYSDAATMIHEHRPSDCTEKYSEANGLVYRRPRKSCADAASSSRL